MRRSARRGSLALPLLVAGALPACSSGFQAPSIVLIVVDTLRADHVESYGYSRPTTPGVRGLAREATTFDAALTVQGLTTPAVASIMTGRYPARHGVKLLSHRLHDANRTLAEHLSAAGYQTAAFVSSFVMVREFSHLDQGFEVYDDFVSERELYRESYERRAGGTLGAARHWLETRADDRPFFLFLHLIDPHGPYAPPGEFAGRFVSGERTAVAAPIPSYQQIPGLHHLAAYVDRYDGEIAYLDHELGAFLDFLRRRQRFEDAVVVFTADHGESLGERGVYFRHGSNVHQENLHVPLIVKPCAGMAALPERVSQPVSLVDLLPTLLEFAGLTPPLDLDGRSLAPLWRGGVPRPASVFGVSDSREGRSLAIVEGHRKTIVRVDPEGRASVVSYDLATDEREARPAPLDEGALARLRARQASWSAAPPPFAVEDNPFMPLESHPELIREVVFGRIETSVDAEAAARLRSLGYIE